MKKLTDAEKADKAYKAVKTIINTHCMSNAKWTAKKQEKLDKAYDRWFKLQAKDTGIIWE